MKRIFFLATLSSMAIFAKAQSVEKLKTSVHSGFGRLDSAEQLESDSKYDSIGNANSELAKTIVTYAETTPNFLQKTSTDGDPFSSVTSDDKKLKIVYWDDAEGGSVRLYDYIVFWEKDNKLSHSIILLQEQEDNHESYINNIYVDSIVHLKQSNRSDLYFIMGGTLSRPEYWQTIFCYKISSAGELTTDAPVFKTNNKTLSLINVNCVSHDYNDATGTHIKSFYDLLHFSNDKRTLYVPIFPDKNKSEKEQEAEDEDTSGNRKFSYFRYLFDGTNFVFKK